MEWLVIKVTWNRYEHECYIDEWNMLLVWLGHNSMIVSWWCLMWSGGHSMTPFSGSSWWCLIYI